MKKNDIPSEIGMLSESNKHWLQNPYWTQNICEKAMNVAISMVGDSKDNKHCHFHLI